MMPKSSIGSFLGMFGCSIGNGYSITGIHVISNGENLLSNGINLISKAANPGNALDMPVLHVNRVRAGVFGLFFTRFFHPCIFDLAAITSIDACNLMKSDI